MNECDVIDMVGRYEAEVSRLEATQRSRDTKPADSNYIGGKIFVYETVIHELKTRYPELFNIKSKII